MSETVAVVRRLNVIHKTTMLFLLNIIVNIWDFVDIVRSSFDLTKCYPIIHFFLNKKKECFLSLVYKASRNCKTITYHFFRYGVFSHNNFNISI